ncbi:MAG TPA: efflux RND transporter periplasmic adaptor subunit [Bryobacteraceae bacterium]|nr:efflux RND transporter periplasmic adaptor subunit [Bryobacteraceae bacterium]
MPTSAIKPILRTAPLLCAAAVLLSSCAQREVAASVQPAGPAATVGVTKVTTRPLSQNLTISSELVPFQQIDVYAKEAGYVKKLLVDYGTHVKAGQLMAVLEIPELEAQLQQDEAEIRAQTDQVKRASDEVGRVKAQHEVAHLQYQRIAGVAKSQPGLVAQQEVDDWQGKDLAAESQLEAARGALAATESQLEASKAKLVHDQALYSYSRITAPFDGVVTQRYANLGALMQAGTNSTQATPLVRLSQENLYRLVIPVPESYVRYIKVGDPVEVRVPALNKSFRGKVTRFSVDVTADTRTMHTEVDIPNPNNQLLPGVYAEAVLTLNQQADAPVVPLQALNHNGNQSSVFVVGPDNRVEDRPITIGVQTPNYVEVMSGVRPGEKVIITDRSGIKPGEQVKPQLTAAMAWQGSGQQEQ